MPPLPRALIDDAVVGYFTAAVLDVEETGRRAAEAASGAIREAAELRAAAEKAALDAERAVLRMQRDYRAGDLSARRFEAMIDDAERDLDAARAEAERLREQEQAVQARPDLPEALEALQAELLEPLRGADTVAAIRAALRKVFDHFVVVRIPLERVEREFPAEYLDRDDGEEVAFRPATPPEGPMMRQIETVEPHLTHDWPLREGQETHGAPPGGLAPRVRTEDHVLYVIPRLRPGVALGEPVEGWIPIPGVALDPSRDKYADSFVT